MMSVDAASTADAYCAVAVHVASAASQAEDASTLVWSTHARCDADIAPRAAWFAIHFAYPLPAGAVLLDANHEQRPIDKDGRITGVAFARPPTQTSPLHFSIRVKNVSRGPDARLTPPLLEMPWPQVVAFDSSDLSFEPHASLDPQARASAMAITLGDVSHGAYREALRNAQNLAVHWRGPAIVVHATPLIKERHGIDGELATRAHKTQGVYLGVGLVSAAAALGLVFIALRFKRQSDDEHAEAVLRSEIDAL